VRRACRNLLAAIALLAAAPGAANAACSGAAYAYAGLQARTRAHGVAATVSLLSTPTVTNGHVAAWVGLGGPGMGPNRSDEWVQVGLASFDDGGTYIYYEVARPGSAPEYVQVGDAVLLGESHRLAVLEITHHREWWRVWVDGRPVSAPLHLAGSSGTWSPMATSESWDGGTPGACNAYEYGFAGLSVATARGGNWQQFKTGARREDAGYRVLATVDGGFVAGSA